jgi:transcription antitermination factor NusG
MERKWYIISTAAKQERRVAALLAKKGIENYCPCSTSVIKNGTREIVEVSPLFKGFVFVHICATQIPYIRRTANVINMVYWRSKPVVVSSEEIDGIRLMVDSYTGIKVQSVPVNPDRKMFVEKENTTEFGGTTVSIKHKGLSITLPSIGFRLSARVERRGGLLPEKKTGVTVMLPRILNPLYLFGF